LKAAMPPAITAPAKGTGPDASDACRAGEFAAEVEQREFQAGFA
jgi:hypothetical protein